MRSMIKDIVTLVVGGVLLFAALAGVAWLVLRLYGIPIPAL